jgi:hypothetical protein
MLLPYTRLELPAWNRLLRAAKVSGYKHDSDVWAFAPTKTIRGKVHGYLMNLDLTDWSQRKTYFLGRYYELHIQLLLQKVLKNGDRVVDVGANIGMITLCASALVGDSGIVKSFEPNPECLDALTDILTLNRIKNVAIHPVGLSDVQDRMTLRIVVNREHPSGHSGVGTLAHVVETADDRLLTDKDRCGRFRVPRSARYATTARGLASVGDNRIHRIISVARGQQPQRDKALDEKPRIQALLHHDTAQGLEASPRAHSDGNRERAHGIRRRPVGSGLRREKWACPDH